MTGRLAASGVDVVLAGNHILQNLDIDIGPGELTSLVGPNGAGKTTVFAALSGDLEPTRGQVLLDGTPVRTYRPKELALRRAVLPQDHLVRFSYSVEEVVHLARLSHPSDPATDEKVVSESLDAAEVSHMRRRDVQTLSGGEMARTAFARTLAQTTPIVLLDEPTAALDLRHQEAVLRHARRLRDDGACVVVVLHDLNLASAYSDRVIMLHDGKVVADGPPSTVFTAERIKRVYRQEVLVTNHPTRSCPLIVTTD
ncbi:heme ABC transporter ATP-binding protein [Streptomyces sp. AJS327]|uniref:heme ABC transporter ATP-binding protein n=1 Tax=Streptomyces sp. AJS327 TaxID=2545265 RepID=UPI0015DE7BBB|nr:heme ABC transporter ATP-binding protein [Streptomyces sp. AJS327]MBA0049665.1 heme ABC transporter ATP-binding protein [Streptomyces sp. AJS327]